MSIARSLLLAASRNQWLRHHGTRYKFVRHSVSRFMPGETLEEAVGAARRLRTMNIGTVFTYLGENVKDPAEAKQVAAHYLQALDKTQQEKLRSEISVKLTQLGLDLSHDLCYEHLQSIVQREDPGAVVWIDMESTQYVDATLAIYKRLRRSFPNVGICLQAYLHRTAKDLQELLLLCPSVRLVKGAYDEPPVIAFSKMAEVNDNYFALAQELIRAKSEKRCHRAAFGTHDVGLIARIAEFARSWGITKKDFEVHMLYGIQRAEQERLAQAGCTSMVLVAYGSYWYPWFVRRLAERPANVWFLLRNIFVN